MFIPNCPKLLYHPNLTMYGVSSVYYKAVLFKLSRSPPSSRPDTVWSLLCSALGSSLLSQPDSGWCLLYSPLKFFPNCPEVTLYPDLTVHGVFSFQPREVSSQLSQTPSSSEHDT
jgi:hypothetical protein